MSMTRTPAAVVLGLALAALPAVYAQNRGGSPQPLTALDLIQLQQLVAEAQYALYTGADEGRLYASLFTPDGASDAVRGSQQLTAHAKGGRPGLRSLVTNVVIEPTAAGAAGHHYEFTIRFVKDRDQPVEFGTTGRYDDTFVKTAQGWRIRTRVLVPSVLTSEASKAIVPAGPPPAAGTTPPVPTAVPITRPRADAFRSTLSAMDYIEIQQLVASYGQALDNGLRQDDNGKAYASLFAPGAVFGRPYTTGEEPLMALARTQPHHARFTRHFLTNIVIEPSPEGAVGRQYLVVLDQAEGGKPTSVLIGGHYEDVYVKTPSGWKFKQRTLYPARSGEPSPAPAPAAR